MFIQLSEKTPSKARYIRSFLGLFIFCFSLTVLFLGMRAVMEIGGFCAQGGPYEIAVECPKGIAILMPLSIFAMILGGILYFSALLEKGPKWGFLFWSALFISLGWNFLEFGIYAPIGNGIAFGWVIPGIVFELMGLAPILLIRRKDIINIIFGTGNIGLLLMHLAALISGVYLGFEVYSKLT